MPEKVYCKNCKYLKWENEVTYYGGDYICLKATYFFDTWHKPLSNRIVGFASTKNSNNDCPDFEVKKPWWCRFIK